TGGTIQYKDQNTDLTGRHADPSGYPNRPAGQPDPRRSWSVVIPTTNKESDYEIVNQVNRDHEQAHVDSLTRMFQQFKDGKIDWNTWARFSSFGNKGQAMKPYVEDEINHYEAGMKT